jgi:hypothetical protein
MEIKKKFLLVFVWMGFVICLSACDLFGGGSAEPFIGDILTQQALDAQSALQGTQTAAPRQTWTAQANQTLTALPANETATSAAMGATETSAAVATQQLFTREAQTGAANFTATKLALERVTNTPTQTPTFTRTHTPTSTQTPTSTPTPAPQLAKCDSVTLGSIQQQGQKRLNTLYKGKPTKQTRKDVTDFQIAFAPAQSDHLNNTNASMLYNGYTLDGQPQAGDTWSFQLIALCFSVVSDAQKFLDISRAEPSTLQDRSSAQVPAPPYTADLQCENAKTAPQNNVQLDVARCEMLEDYYVIMWFITAFSQNPDELHESFTVPFMQDLSSIFNP